MKSKKQPKSKLVRFPSKTIDKLNDLRTNKQICPLNSRPSYNTIVSNLIQYYKTNNSENPT